MSKYSVLVNEIRHVLVRYTVEADSPEEAKELASDVAIVASETEGETSIENVEIVGEPELLDDDDDDDEE